MGQLPSFWFWSQTMCQCKAFFFFMMRGPHQNADTCTLLGSVGGGTVEQPSIPHPVLKPHTSCEPPQCPTRPVARLSAGETRQTLLLFVSPSLSLFSPVPWLASWGPTGFTAGSKFVSCERRDTLQWLQRGLLNADSVNFQLVSSVYDKPYLFIYSLIYLSLSVLNMCSCMFVCTYVHAH